jgi:DNA modification methylase
MGRKRGTGVRALQKERVRAREDLERKWYERMEVDPTLADLVTGEQAKAEPLHRWLPFRQQFAPALVRRFLSEAGAADPVLDPFSGSGTVAIECARAGRAAIGVEAIPVLAWATQARFSDRDPERLRDVLVASRTVTGEGRRKEPEPLGGIERSVEVMVAADRARPLPGPGRVIVGDARRLPLADGSVGGVLTSPPYLSRYDYSRITAAMDAAWRRGRSAAASPQMRATLQGRGAVGAAGGSRRDEAVLPAAAREAVAAVGNLGRRKDAAVIRAYFDDLMDVLSELFRVTRPGAPVWIVIGAADFQREYVPADLIAAEIGESVGFQAGGIVEARRLRQSGRLLGGLKDVAPRESVVKLVHPGAS